MKKETNNKKHFIKKYFTKNRVKANIIAISVTGILVGVTAITLGVYFGATACQSSHIPSDAKVINKNINNKYIVQVNKEIYVRANVPPILSHNKLLDLASYVLGEDINTSNFVIKGEIDFGILVNFDEDMNLFGYSQSLMKLGTKDSRLDTNTFGIIVGSTSQPTTSKDIYHGEMHIDNSVNASLNTTNSVYGVYLWNISNASIDIDGVFMIDCDYELSQVYEIFFYNVGDSSVSVGGVFMLTNSGGISVGVYFGSVNNGAIEINGIFTINAWGMIYGVGLNDILDSDDVNINGIFTLNDNSTDAPHDVCGIKFINNLNNTSINIGGVFTLNAYSNDVLGLDFSNNTVQACNIYVDGVFALNSFNATTKGVDILIDPIVPFYNTTSTPQFFSKKIDDGGLLGYVQGAQYQWNGKQVNYNSSLTTTDDDLSILPVIARGNTNFWIDVIKTSLTGPNVTIPNQNIFNQAYQNGLNNYLNAHTTCSKNVIGWLRDIIKNIPYKPK